MHKMHLDYHCATDEPLFICQMVNYMHICTGEDL